MCLRLKCPLASSFHAGTETKQAEQQWVSQSQPPASQWNQRNHKNVTASVIILPAASLPDSLPQKIAARLAVSLSLRHTQPRSRVLCSLSSSHLWHTDSFLTAHFACFLSAHTHTEDLTVQNHTLQFAFLLLRTAAKPRKHRGKFTDKPSWHRLEPASRHVKSTH